MKRLLVVLALTTLTASNCQGKVEASWTTLTLTNGGQVEVGGARPTLYSARFQAPAVPLTQPLFLDQDPHTHLWRASAQLDHATQELQALAAHALMPFELTVRPHFMVRTHLALAVGTVLGPEGLAGLSEAHPWVDYFTFFRHEGVDVGVV